MSTNTQNVERIRTRGHTIGLEEIPRMKFLSHSCVVRRKYPQIYPSDHLNEGKLYDDYEYRHTNWNSSKL